ncbi:hypothetical protein GUITHDRAFT_118877 [Guillardia theta CCMP2712]|uniref:Uncharacterized protein n=1 Tax=Guillardia theta (strain CCMP2712) TaxID=905079 RepID=L1IFT9_GUITC|nr:hypothetical protein GUITHDRAFT_118877 [Guillardia theta CCMP2712]EKX34942.1 hypothetical protein GUITHDRAFT_118877 [Guillardia theta CCMP2712]|eukprot:XP_005821922.1 hypothetical protein GUITHDRAFT_118877 [Guillardia theta CCMP2712]
MSWNPTQGIRKTGGSRFSVPRIQRDAGKVTTPPTPELSAWKTSPKHADGAARLGDTRVLKIVTPTSELVEVVQREESRENVRTVCASMSTQTEEDDVPSLREQEERHPILYDTYVEETPDMHGDSNQMPASRSDPTTHKASVDWHETTRGDDLDRADEEKGANVKRPSYKEEEDELKAMLADYLSAEGQDGAGEIELERIEDETRPTTSHRDQDVATSERRRRKLARMEEKGTKQGASPRELQLVPFTYPSLVGQYDPASDSVVIGLDVGTQGVLDLRDRFTRAFERELNLYSESRGYCSRLKRQSHSARKVFEDAGELV